MYLKVCVLKGMNEYFKVQMEGRNFGLDPEKDF